MKFSDSFVVFSLLTLGLSPAANAIDFSSVPAARSVEESKQSLRSRQQLVLEYFAAQEQGPYGFHTVGSFYAPGLAKLGLGVDLASVNLEILKPEAKAYAKPGTEFSLGPFCRRDGDYDFMLIGLVRMAALYGSNPDKIWPDSYDKILHQLLNVKGTDHHVSICLDICGCRAETENHTLMTESSRYLTNQLLYKAGIKDGYDNAENGFNGWLVQHLRRFLKYGFSEYNSRPYQIYSVHPLQNLYDFADDATVKLSAQMVLDFLSAKFAVQSNSLRRSVPFRRKMEYADNTRLLIGDGEAARYAVLAGNTEIYSRLETPGHSPYGDGHMIASASTAYRVPDPILDLMIRKDRGTYFQKFRNPLGGIEVLWSSPSFMLSAGGRFVPMFDMGTGENDGRALATVLMPTLGGADSSEYIRIAGHKKESKRHNTCVAPGFACGLNPVVPDSIPESCIERTGNWTLVNTEAAECPLQHRYYAAVYSKPCDTGKCRKGGGRFGFMEAVESSSMSFGAFKSHVLEKNSRAYRSDSENLYVTATGRRVHFIPQPSDKEWEVIRIDGAPVVRKFAEWAPAEGDVMRADGKGKVVFRNPALKQCVVLDHRDPLAPRRYTQACDQW